ncbi:MAG: ribosome maturation factor RimM [Bacteroidia bacterium]
MERKDCVELGYIAKAHGLKGEVRAVFDVHNLSEYKREESFYLAKKGEALVSHKLTLFRVLDKGNAILQFEGYTDRDASESLRSHTIFFPIENLQPLPDGHFYFFQVVGYQVVDKTHGPMGTVKGIFDGQAQDVLAIDYNGHELLVPVTDQFVLQADHENKTLHTAVPEGLLEVYTEEKDKS